MRIFLAGASGVIGQHLVPLLVAEGHEVAGMTRTPSKVDWLRSLGAEPVVCDVFDRGVLFEVVDRLAPDVAVHQLTDLPDDPAHVLAQAAANNRMRREGTTNLVDAAQAYGVRVIAQSVAWLLAGDGGVAVEFHERAVLDAGGVVVRYGRLFGPGTYYEGEPPPAPRVHVVDAARRTLAALDAPSGAIMTIEDRPG